MTESDITDADPQQNPDEESCDTPPLSEEDSTGDPWLDKLLSEGILKGRARLGLAQTCMAAFVIAAVGWITFSGTASSPFLLGDLEPLVERAALHQVATISRGWDAEIGPISAFTYAINWFMGDGSAFPFQVTQIAIHLLNSLLVFLLCRRLVKGRDGEALPMAAGLLFAVHPVSTYAVNTLTDRDLLLGTFFMLLSLVLYLGAIQAERVGWTRVVLSLISFGLAWVCGAWVCVLPILVVAFTLAVEGWSWLKKHALCAGLYFVVAAFLLPPEMLLRDGGGVGRIAVDSIFRDAGHFPDYVRAWIMPGAEAWVYLPDGGGEGIPVLFAGFVIVGVVAVFRFPRVALLALWPICVAIGTGMGIASEQFENAHIYPASIGFAFMIPVIMDGFPKGVWRTTGGVAVALAIFMCVGITHGRNMDWKDEIYFWSRANEDCPECFEENFLLAQAYHAEGDRAVDARSGEESDAGGFDRARRSWKTAEVFYRVAEESAGGAGSFGPGYARIQYLQGNLDGALAAMEEALAFEPGDTEAVRAAATWYGERFSAEGDPDDLRNALSYLEVLESREAVGDSERLDWARHLSQLGSYPSAGKQLKRLQDRGVRAEAAALLGELGPRLNLIAAQQKAFDEAMAKGAALPDVIRMRAQQDESEGRIVNARYLNEELIRLTGNEHAEDWYSLGQISFTLGEWNEYVAHWAPPSGLEQPWRAMAARCAAQKKWAVGLRALMERAEFRGAGARAEALLTLAEMAIAQNETGQAANIYRQMAQENPKRVEPWLALADMAIEAKQSEAVRDFLRQAESLGASQVAIGTRRSRAGIKPSAVDVLKPTRIR